MTTKGVMKLSEDDQHVLYRTGCSCGEPRHDIGMYITRNTDSDDISWYFYTNATYYSPSAFYGTFWTKCVDIWERMKASLKLLFTGFLEYDSEFLIEDPEIAQNIINELNEGREYLLNKEKEQEKCKCNCKDKLLTDKENCSNISAFPKDSLMNKKIKGENNE